MNGRLVMMVRREVGYLDEDRLILRCILRKIFVRRLDSLEVAILVIVIDFKEEFIVVPELYAKNLQ